MLRQIAGRRRRRRQRMRWFDGITNTMDMNLSKLQQIVKEGKPNVLQFMGSQSVRHKLATEQQQNICFEWRFPPKWKDGTIIQPQLIKSLFLKREILLLLEPGIMQAKYASINLLPLEEKENKNSIGEGAEFATPKYGFGY